jgi:hypothetical protein
MDGEDADCSDGISLSPATLLGTSQRHFWDKTEAANWLVMSLDDRDVRGLYEPARASDRPRVDRGKFVSVLAVKWLSYRTWEFLGDPTKPKEVGSDSHD